MTSVSDGWSADTEPGRPDSKIGAALFDLLLNVPASAEPAHAQPAVRAQAIMRSAARRAAAVSGALALPPGPLGLLTIVPDLVTIWKIQQQMVVDIAATFGRRAHLRREVMIYCLFKHGGAALVRDLVVRVGERVLVRETSLRAVQQILRRVGVRVTQQMIGRNVARWIPLLGAIGTGAYAFFDTKQVAATAVELFSRELGQLPPALPKAPSADSLPPPLP
jgi:hypothetical protein